MFRSFWLAAATVAAGSVFAASTGSTPVTFYKDVLPVLQKNCQSCHRPGEAAPMSFLTYESTRPWAKAIKAAVSTTKMPPWFADPHYGKFANDRRMNEAEVAVLRNWADAGSPAGDPKQGPAPLAFADGWAIGKPDMVFEMPTAFEVPASGTIDYQYIAIPTNFKEDTWIQIAEARPDDRTHVHHILAFIREPGTGYMKDLPIGIPMTAKQMYETARKNAEALPPAERQKLRQRGNASFADLLAGYAPGTPPTTLRPGQAKLVKAGSDLVLQMHYTADGKPGKDKSRIGIIISKAPVAERVVSLASGNSNFEIPPGDPDYRIDSSFTLGAEAKLVSLLPHMHLRGKSFEYTAIYPTGEKEKLLSVPKYDFNWQLWYELAEPKVLPAGTRIDCIAHYDNSPNNPANPDPKAKVRNGEQSWDEMMLGFFDVAIKADLPPAALMKGNQRPPSEGRPTGEE